MTLLQGFGVIAAVYAAVWVSGAEVKFLAPLMGFILLVGLIKIALRRNYPLVNALLGATLLAGCAWLAPWFHGRLRVQPLSMAQWLVLLGGGAVGGWFGGRTLAELFAAAEQHLQERGRNVYAVPRKFGIGTLLVATTFFAMLFGILQWAGARPEHLFFYSAFVVTVSLAQMVFERSPRWASILAGGFYLPLSMLLIPLIQGRPIWRGVASTSVVEWLLIGLCLGYLGGALIAGTFLTGDFINRTLLLRGRVSRTDG